MTAMRVRFHPEHYSRIWSSLGVSRGRRTGQHVQIFGSFLVDLLPHAYIIVFMLVEGEYLSQYLQRWQGLPRCPGSSVQLKSRLRLQGGEEKGGVKCWMRRAM